MKPGDRLPWSVEYKGKRYKLNMSYVAFFTASDVLQDKRMSDADKLVTVLDIFVKGRHPVEPELLTAVYELVKEDRPQMKSEKVMDLKQDWSYICAAFQQAYGIDLYKDKDMHILQFQALLQGIPKGTKLSDIVGIRSAKIPKPTKYNAEQIAELTRLKAFYALRGDDTTLQDGLAKLFTLLEARAK